MQKRTIGNTNLSVDTLGIGGAPLGGNFADLDAADAAALLATGLNAGITYVDTAPFYGFGRSERVVGDAIRGRDYVLSTKVGRLLEPGPDPDPWASGMINPLPFHPVYDYTYDGVMRSFEASLHRLGLDRIDILFAHDIGEMTHGVEANAKHFADLTDSGYRAMDELRRNGNVTAIGLGVNEAEICLRAMDIGDWDTFLLAGRYTLLEQNPLDDLIPACMAAGTTIVTGGPFNSGVMVGRENWNYAKAPADIIERVARLKAVCADHNVPLPAAALHFPLAHPVVSSVIPGTRSAAEFAEILHWAHLDIPAALWRDLRAANLLHSDAPVPNGNPFFDAGS